LRGSNNIAIFAKPKNWLALNPPLKAQGKADKTAQYKEEDTVLILFLKNK
jgi:hypothetical protein